MKKFIVFGILLICLALSSSISDSKINQKIENESIEYSEIKPFSNNEEFITKITAFVCGEEIKVKGNGLIRQLELWTGETYSDIKIIGFKKPLYPLYKSYFNITPSYINVPRFIGLTIPVENLYVDVIGFALGDIEWE